MNFVFALLALAPSLAAAPRFQTDDPVAMRSEEIAALIVPEPKWADDLFDAAFLKAVPPAKLRALCADIHRQFGRVESMRRTEETSPLAGKYEMTLEKGFVIPVTIGLMKSAPHSIVELWFGTPAPGLEDFTAVVDAVKKLPGRTAFGAYELTDKGLVPLAAHADLELFAIGSTFKLYILGALVRAVEEGRRRAEDTVRLEARYRSLPSGRLQTWPIGAPVTLFTLASMMISESDNTATDHLLFALGRENVEAMLEAMGHAQPARNVPFLSTGDLFRMKLCAGGKPADEFVKRDAASRRAYLDAELSKLSLDPTQIDMSLFEKPQHIDDVEWFASPRDLCRAMDWLRRATGSPKTEVLRGVLSINPGIELPKERFDFVGYKGGSEPGVLSLTYLLHARTGAWYALSCSWNDPSDAVDEQKLIGIVRSALGLLGKPAKAASPAAGK